MSYLRQIVDIDNSLWGLVMAAWVINVLLACAKPQINENIAAQYYHVCGHVSV